MVFFAFGHHFGTKSRGFAPDWIFKGFKPRSETTRKLKALPYPKA
jgi:hypothetical protein